MLFHLINDDFISKEKEKTIDKKKNFEEIEITNDHQLLTFDFVINEKKETEQLPGLDIVSSYADLLESMNAEEPINEEQQSKKEKFANSTKIKKQKFLIDNFLQSNTRIVPKETHEENEDISKQSIEEDNDLITETLVRIYIKQGYYFKAIMAYEKLSLKYPEKSIYFANQIKKIKQIINNK